MGVVPSGAAPNVHLRKEEVEIRPASIAQIGQGRNGVMVEIDDDVQGIANALHEIDHHIRLRYSEAGAYFVVYWKPDEGDEGDGYLITTAQDLDHRIVHRVQEIYHRCNQPGYSYSDELDKLDAKAKKDKEHAFSEEHGEMYERMAYALRHDLGYDQSRIYVPEGVKS